MFLFLGQHKYYTAVLSTSFIRHMIVACPDIIDVDQLIKLIDISFAHCLVILFASLFMKKLVLCQVEAHLALANKISAH